MSRNSWRTWQEQAAADKQACEAAYRLKNPGAISGEPTMLIQVTLMDNGITPRMQWGDNPRPPIGRYLCFWIGD